MKKFLIVYAIVALIVSGTMGYEKYLETKHDYTQATVAPAKNTAVNPQVTVNGQSNPNIHVSTEKSKR